MKTLIYDEFASFVASGDEKIMGPHLTCAYEYLQTIKPTSVEAERAFSAAGLICTKIRSALKSSTLDDLCFLNSYFKNLKD